jgi:Lar family restriction alleviation protein
MDNDTISRQAAIDALRYAQHRFTVSDEAGGMGTVKWSENVIYSAAAERVLTELPSVQPETNCSEIPNNSGLQKCPFCGGEATVTQYIMQGSITYGVTCIMCEASVPHKYTNRKTAIRAWNRRAE